MANHKSAIKRIRQSAKRRERNRYFAKTMRNSIRDFRLISDPKTAEEMLPEVISQIDKVAKRNIIHKNKASNLKSSLMKHLNSLKGIGVAVGSNEEE